MQNPSASIQYAGDIDRHRVTPVTLLTRAPCTAESDNKGPFLQPSGGEGVRAGGEVEDGRAGGVAHGHRLRRCGDRRRRRCRHPDGRGGVRRNSTRRVSVPPAMDQSDSARPYGVSGRPAPRSARRRAAARSAGGGSPGRGRPDAADLPVQEVADRAESVVVERVHPRVLERAVGADAVPALPDRRGAAARSCSPSRDSPAAAGSGTRWPACPLSASTGSRFSTPRNPTRQVPAARRRPWRPACPPTGCTRFAGTQAERQRQHVAGLGVAATRCRRRRRTGW